jgi:hypothetical protein
MTDLLGSEVFVDRDLLKFLVRLAIDLTFLSLVVQAVYYRLHRNHEYVFTYYLFNLITFGMCLLLQKVPIELGFALGLFAVFGILRYRTEAIRIRDLTYLFIVLGLGILNGVASVKISVAELLCANVMVVGATALLELRPRTERAAPMLYDNLKLLAPGNEDKLLADLRTRTGLEVVRVDIVRFDMLRDAAEVIVHYVVKSKRSSATS